MHKGISADSQHIKVSVKPFPKACGNPKGKALGRLRRGEISQKQSNRAIKTIKSKAKIKLKSAMQLKKVNPTDVTQVTI